jgi:hypothetical protein
MAGKVLLDVLRHVWIILESLHYPIALMGGLALGFWQRYRTTQDVDVLLGVEPEKVDEILHRLSEAGVRPLRQPAILDLGAVKIIQLIYQPPSVFVDVRIDLLLAESPYHCQALARRVPAKLDDLDVELYALSCEDLIIFKLIANRIIDRADAAALVRQHRQTLDFPYLAHWIGELKLAAEWTEIWTEAFPGEASPFATPASGDR